MNTQALINRAVLIASTVIPLTIHAHPSDFRSRPSRPKVEVVFALDTTGSMGGLIQGAKQKIWSIVNEIADGKPSPDIRLGLVAYRDRGDAYVTSRMDLTRNLDAVYERLMALNADGGGDGPESVNQALYEAVHDMGWSEDQRTLKVVFLVGDAPPHMDYQDDVKYQATCQAATQRDIIISAIQCGDYQGATAFFQDIARRAEGRYVAIAQSGGTVAVATPYDADLARLSSRLDATYLTYGAMTEQRKAKTTMKNAAGLATAAAPEAAAARATYRGGAGALGTNDFLADMAAGAVDMERMDKAQLPEELQGKTQAEQREIVAAKAADRQRLQQQIAELSKKRDRYVKEELAKKGGADDSFDANVMASIKSAAAEVGITY